jgi:cytochrome P450
VTDSAVAVYYDPYDRDIDKDPYPVWRRMRDEAPLYVNEKFGFFALSRFDDVEKASIDWPTYISGRGSVLEIIKAGVEIPPGSILFEDPPTHDAHRSLLSRAFTPRRMAALEAKVREFCARSLDAKAGSDGFDFIADLGAVMPMRTIGMLLGIPEEDQQALRDRFDANFSLAADAPPDPSYAVGIGEEYGTYIDWRKDHPSDDLMTELLNAEFEDHTGVVRTLTREEILGYVGLLAGAGNETTTRLIGWTGKLLAEHPDQRRELVEDPSLIPDAIEEILRIEPPGFQNARYVVEDVEFSGGTVPADSVVVTIMGSANHDDRRFPDPDRFDIHRKPTGILTFSYGIHFCLGAALARLQGRVALEEVLKRFPEWTVDEDRAVLKPTSTTRGYDPLPVVV